VPSNGLVEGIIRTRTFFRVKPKIFDQARTALVLCSLLGGAAYGEARLVVLSMWCLVLLLQGIDRCSGAFLFIILLLFWLCASLMPLGQCVVAQARCYWYLLDINICSLSNKMYMLVGSCSYGPSILHVIHFSLPFS
jgi:hypothetical protein